MAREKHKRIWESQGKKTKQETIRSKWKDDRHLARLRREYAYMLATSTISGENLKKFELCYPWQYAWTAHFTISIMKICWGSTTENINIQRTDLFLNKKKIYSITSFYYIQTSSLYYDNFSWWNQFPKTLQSRRLTGLKMPATPSGTSSRPLYKVGDSHSQKMTKGTTPRWASKAVWHAPPSHVTLGLEMTGC